MQIAVLKIGTEINKRDWDIILSPVSRSQEGKELSPFFLGPVELLRPFKGATKEFANFENAWQYSKAYAKLNHIDQAGNLTDEFRSWWNTGSRVKANRYPAGRGAVPEFSVYGRHRVSYISARKLIYTPLYDQLARTTKLYAELVREYRKGANIVFFDFDASQKQSARRFTENINDPFMKMGHSYVLRESILNSDRPIWWRQLIV